MKKIFFLVTFILSMNSFANTNCTKWESRPDFVKAIEIAASSNGWSYEEACTNSKILDVEAQPSRKILRDGTIVPHVRVQFHYEFDSCLFMINKQTWSISENYCYSGM